MQKDRRKILYRRRCILVSCIFCKIISGEIPSSKVYEDDKVLAFNDINPVAPYHILVIPKKHYESIIDVPENEMDIIAHIHNVMNKIARDKGFDKTGFRIINNCGHDGGQEVKHIHYHVLAGKKLPLYEAMEK
jgi:histidine triad (HIT) family protein